LAIEKVAEEEKNKIKVKESEPVGNEQIGHKEAKHSIANPLGKDLHKEAVTKADGYFKMKRYDEAKTAYQEALQLKPEDGYSKGKLEQITKLMAPK